MSGLSLALLVAAASKWTVLDGVCPDYDRYSAGWADYTGDFQKVEDCEAACNSHNCSTFTFNHHVKPGVCQGYDHVPDGWHMLSNPHCISGCPAALAVTGCGTAPKPGPPPPPPAPAPPGFPRWVGPRPSIKTNSSAGLPPVPNVDHVSVYKSTLPNGDKNPFGVYGHGPMITKHSGVYYMSWYNAPVGEDVNKRSVYAYSTDLATWTAPSVLFDTFTQTDHGANEDGEENGPWTILGATPDAPLGRLYTQSGTQDAGEHHEGIVSVMRRVGVGGDPRALGPPFWLNRSVPVYCNASLAAYCSWPTYLQMDSVTRGDAEQLLASFIRTTVVAPDASTAATAAPPNPFPHMTYNERSLYRVPGSRQLVLLLRGVSGGLSVSMCDLPKVPVTQEQPLFSCRPGVGDAFMNVVELVANASNGSDPRVCNWTAPELSTLPDSGSRTCAGAFPAGAGPTGVYLVGNQIDKGRDPVTLSLSANGRDFDRHWSVRHGIAGKDIDHGGSCPRYPGHAKCCGYQYPGAMVDLETRQMIVSYSIGKEDIALTRFNLFEIMG